MTGSLVAELALVLPLLVVLVLGIFEFGMVFREKSNLSGALRSAARIDTTNGTARSADYLALQSFYAQMAQAKNMTVNKVVIYKTTVGERRPARPELLHLAHAGSPRTCATSTPGRRSRASARNYLTNFGPTDTACAAAAWDVNFCPLNRKRHQSDPPDYVGVYANVTYKSLTGLLPNTITLTDQSVARIDPKVSP